MVTLLRSDGGPARETRPVPSEKSVVPCRSKNDEMPMITACFARVIQWCTGHQETHFLIIFQCVDELGKTGNQLTVISFPEIALNNIVEQDHRAVKRVTRPMLGFKSFDAAQDTLVGIELMHMIKKRQMIMETGEEGLTAAELFYSLAA